MCRLAIAIVTVLGIMSKAGSEDDRPLGKYSKLFNYLFIGIYIDY